MLSRLQFYALSALLLALGIGIAIAGSAVIAALALPPQVARIFNWFVMGLCGGGVSYGAYRRGFDNATTSPATLPRVEVSTATRVLSGILAVAFLAVAPLLIAFAWARRDWSTLLAGVGGLILAVAFGYAAVIGRDPAVLLLVGLRRWL